MTRERHIALLEERVRSLEAMVHRWVASRGVSRHEEISTDNELIREARDIGQVYRG